MKEKIMEIIISEISKRKPLQNPDLLAIEKAASRIEELECRCLDKALKWTSDRKFIHSPAEEISIILDKHEATCPLEKQEIIDEINDRFIDRCFFEKSIKGMDNLSTPFADDKKDRIEALDKWISVEDRLPESNEPVLVYNGRRMFEVSWEMGTDQDLICFQRKYSYWRPLPEPPKTK